MSSVSAIRTSALQRCSNTLQCFRVKLVYYLYDRRYSPGHYLARYFDERCFRIFRTKQSRKWGASMKKQAGNNRWMSKILFVLLAASAAFWCDSASASGLNCSTSSVRSCGVQSHIARANSSMFGDFVSTAANSFHARAGDFDLTGGNGIILPGPQSFKKPSADVEFQTQLPAAATQPLPEPSTIVLLATGLLGIGVCIRRP